MFRSHIMGIANDNRSGFWLSLMSMALNWSLTWEEVWTARRRRWRQCRRDSHTFNLISLSDILDFFRMVYYSLTARGEQTEWWQRRWLCLDGRRPATTNIDLSSKFLSTEVTTKNVLIVRLTRLRRWRVLAASQSQGRVGQVRLCSLTPSESQTFIGGAEERNMSGKVRECD